MVEVDWWAIEQAYRGSRRSLRAIAREHGVTERAIRERAEQCRWGDRSSDAQVARHSDLDKDGAPAAAETTARQQRGRQWRKGESGNPAGRPRGARHRATVTAEQLLDGEAEAITRKAVELALEGDTVALRLVLERILPPRKERPLRFALPRLNSAVDAPVALAAIADAVAAGELTAAEAAELGRLVDAFVRAVEAADLEERLAALECQVGKES